jgi:uncharacterized protein YdeI (YjbR/CyaY-like superfamily)
MRELDKPVVFFESAKDWETWLDAHHETSDGVWIQIAKKSTGLVSVDYREALEVALCFGWIDGQRRPTDDTHFVQKFTPRRPRSKWSQINVAHIARLTKSGRMRPAGRREVEAAKADGRWDAAYASQSTIEVPDDFQAALDARPEAAAFFATLSRTNRYPFLFRIHDAKRADTRARRIAQYVELLADGKHL